MPQMKYVFGTRTKKWHLVDRDDRDYDKGFSQYEFKILGKRRAKKEYLKPSIIR